MKEQRTLTICILFVVFPLLLSPDMSFAWEKVENVRVEQVGEQVQIYFDLSGDADRYVVKVKGSADGGRTYTLPMKSVSGDIGKEVRPGRGRKIIWRTLKDVGELEGETFVFEVEAIARTPKAITNSFGMELVYISPNTFVMGSPPDEPKRGDNERQHQVTISRPFYFQTTEVTQRQWKMVMGDNPSRFKSCGPDCPMVPTSWNDVQEFMGRLNRREGTYKYRLPTEAEWEYACRAGTTTPFPTGNCISADQANYNGGYPLPGCPKGIHRGGPIKVKSFAPNPWGLYDMHGNVSEWCQDRAGVYPTGHVTDPTGPASGEGHVLRGGSWEGGARRLRSADRDWCDPQLRVLVGFRVAKGI
jgi:formylglycine-generating enzyme required for sulfatase activity